MSGGMRRVGSTAARLARLPYHRRVCRAEFHFPEPPPLTGEAVTGPSVQEWVERAHDMGVEMTVVSAEVDRGTPRFHSRLLPPHPRVDEDRLSAFLQYYARPTTTWADGPTPMLPPAIFDEAEGVAASSDVTTFFALQEVPPIHDVAVVFNDHRVRSARLPLAQTDLEVSDAPHGVLVPKVDLHEVLIARLA